MTRIAALTALFFGALAAPAAMADTPLREGRIDFSFTMDDFFAPSGQSCDFPVSGSWQGTLTFTTFFFAGTDQPARVVTNVDFEGTLSNPLNGKSVPDADHHDTITDHFAQDGTFLKGVENESRDDSLLHAAFHVVIDGDGMDAGRDWFTTAKVVIDIAPLCDALS